MAVVVTDCQIQYHHGYSLAVALCPRVQPLETCSVYSCQVHVQQKDVQPHKSTQTESSALPAHVETRSTPTKTGITDSLILFLLCLIRIKFCHWNIYVSISLYI